MHRIHNPIGVLRADLTKLWSATRHHVPIWCNQSRDFPLIVTCTSGENIVFLFLKFFMPNLLKI